jgi:GntR family transcriptional regulator
VLRLGPVKGDAVICGKLGLAEGAIVTGICRVRYLNREPVSVDYSYLAPEIGSRLSKSSLGERDMFSLLENELGRRLHSADVEIDATSATEEVAASLKIRPGSPVLRIERLTYAQQEKPLVFEYLLYRAENFKYKLKISR